MQTHTLKTLAPYWEAIKSGDKNFEVQRDDRGFQKGDLLVLEKLQEANASLYEIDYAANKFGHVAKRIHKRITYVLTGGRFGIEPGYVVLGLADPLPTQPAQDKGT